MTNAPIGGVHLPAMTKASPNLLRLRLDRLVASGRLSARDAERFEGLDGQMQGQQAPAMDAFHRGREYRALLERIVDGLVELGEPFADKKKKVLLEEIGTMGPAVFLTPWEMTLASLDQRVGAVDQVLAFYSNEPNN